MKLPKLTEHKNWRGTHKDIGFKIVKSESFNPESFRDNWCYYVYIPESKCVNFELIWLEDQETQFSEKGRKYITHDYYKPPIGNVEMHGGITYYSKHGHTQGHRTVEIGCDYQHYWDDGRVYTMQEVLYDAMSTINHLYESNILINKETEEKEQ